MAQNTTPTDETPEVPTYALTDRVLPWFEGKMAALQAKAERLGVPAPTWTILDQETVELETGEVITYTTVTVEGDAPKFDGWTMAAVIDLDPQDGGDEHLVAVIGDRDTDPTWRTETDRCDHCGPTTARGRRKLVVVEHDSGERKVVGTTCLRDFLGHQSPEGIAGWAQMLASLRGEIEEALADDREYDGPREELRVSPTRFLGWTVRAISECGWMSKGRAGWDDTPTVEVAHDLMFPPKATPSYKLPAPLTEAELTEAEAALEWATTVGGSDYLDNVRVLAGKAGWRWKDLGLGASIVAAYQREQARLAEQKARREIGAASEFIGEPKQRLTVTGEVVMAREFDGFYGVKTLVKIVTDEGNIVTWWASSSAPDMGDRVTGKATVKEHEEYRGERQTVITRFSWELADGDDAAGSR